jgi:5-methylcytosine-specific restriction endonuclease McrA
MADSDSNHVIISRKEARERGLKRYFTGKPCKHGHLVQRYIGTGHCIACDNASCSKGQKKHRAVRTKSQRQWRIRNRARHNATIRQRRKNPVILEKHNAINSRWRDKNPNYINEWRENNPEKHKAIVHKRLSRKKNSGGVITAVEIKEIYRLQGGKCAYCKQVLGTKYQVDHIVPLANGGRNETKNVQLLCAKRKGSCNQRKHAKDPIDFARSIGLLL